MVNITEDRSSVWTLEHQMVFLGGKAIYRYLCYITTIKKRLFEWVVVKSLYYSARFSREIN